MQIGLDKISLANWSAFSKMTPDNKSLQLSAKGSFVTVKGVLQNCECIASSGAATELYVMFRNAVGCRLALQ
jgi:hypothetical protein